MKKTYFMSAGLIGLALAAAPVAFAQAGPDQATPSQGADRHHGGGQRGFDAMDTNHDGFITLDEWKAAGRREERFNEIDADHDGKITREELRAFMEKMRAEHQQNGGGGNWGGGNGGGGQNDGH